ncbi:MAG: efflux RND transporter periplasmic adaptor subunit [Ignavibacteria bacterium]
MKKNIKIISITLIILVIAAIIILPKLLSTKEKPVSPQTADTKNAPVPATGFVITTADLENSIRTIGTIVANEEVELRSETSKKITGIYFKEGSFVGKGKTLFKLDDAELDAQMNKLLIEEELAIKNEDRERQLIERGLATQSEYDIFANTLEKIRADIEIVGIQLSKTSIRAPFSGTIGLKNVSIGSYVTPSTILATIQDIRRVKLDFSLPEKYIANFNIGQQIKFNIDGLEEEFDGIVTAYEPKVEGNTRSLTVRAVSSNSSRKLLPGTFANVTLQLSNISEAIMIPTQALIPKLKGHDVYVLKNGLAKLSDVQTGLRTESSVQITSGLNAGDTILTTNILRLRPDAKIVIEKIEQ